MRCLPSNRSSRCSCKSLSFLSTLPNVRSIVKSGETIASQGYVRKPGGKGANVACAIAHASREDAVHFCGTISHEDVWLKETLEKYGVGTSELKTSETVSMTGQRL